MILYGPPGSGKSTIGSILGHMQGKKHIDTDTVFVSRHGDISDFIRAYGESIFRQKEGEILQESMSTWRDNIISLGGGTLLLERNQKLADRYGTVITLMADTEILIRRIQGDRINNRPFANTEHTMRNLMSERFVHYNSQRVHYIIGVDESPEQIAQNMMML